MTWFKVLADGYSPRGVPFHATRPCHSQVQLSLDLALAWDQMQAVSLASDDLVYIGSGILVIMCSEGASPTQGDPGIFHCSPAPPEVIMAPSQRTSVASFDRWDSSTGGAEEQKVQI
ncbi:hypothetical protein M513_12796 [Trichuris suis]|uniref:Uncharacterized protein n=1 Tax=Trichuris suis TaxID=68888 RepID=A0A085LMX2_9BILA|nr:hypothetical protein M513_12796 [Trichuris suis]